MLDAGEGDFPSGWASFAPLPGGRRTWSFRLVGPGESLSTSASRLDGFFAASTALGLRDVLLGLVAASVARFFFCGAQYGVS